MVARTSIAKQIEAPRNRYYLTDAELNSGKFKLAKLIACFLRQLSMCDPESVYQVLKYKWSTRGRFIFGDRERRSGESLLARKEIKRVWPLLVLLLYVKMSIVSLFCLVYQHESDTNRFRLQQLRDSVRPNDTGNSSHDLELCSEFGPNSTECRLERELNERIAASYESAKRVGNPFIFIAFNMQLGFLIALGIYYLFDFHIPLFWNFGPQMELPLANLLLDERSEWERCQRIVESEVRLVKDTSRNYLVAAFRLAIDGLAYASHKSAECCNTRGKHDNKSALIPRSDGGAICITEHLQNHGQLVGYLDRLVASGRLHPINRRSAEWRDRLVTDFVRFSIGVKIYSSIVVVNILFVFPRLTPHEMDFKTWADWLMFFEIWLYDEFTVTTISYFVTTFITNYMSQSRHMKHLTEQIKRQIAENEHQFLQLAEDEPSIATSRSQARMNMALVKVYLDYRIFRAQLTNFLTFLTHGATISLVVMFITPIIGRIFSPYLPSTMAAAVVTIFSAMMIFVVDLFLVPICFFYHQGQKLYRALSSLLAHAIELDRQARSRFAGRPIYMASTIEMIRKELDDPERMMGKYLISVPGFKATFPSLMELHFYYSVLNLAFYCEVDLWKNLLGDRFSDPLLLRRPLEL